MVLSQKDKTNMWASECFNGVTPLEPEDWRIYMIHKAECGMPSGVY